MSSEAFVPDFAEEISNDEMAAAFLASTEPVPDGAAFALPWLKGAYRLGYRRAGPPPERLDPEQLATLFRVPPWICANVGSSWGPLRRLAWRVRYWTWDL